MNEETIPLHHYPSTQGLDQAMQTPPDAWLEFFTLCREHAAQIRQQRAEKHKVMSEAVSGEAVQELQ